MTDASSEKAYRSKRIQSTIDVDIAYLYLRSLFRNCELQLHLITHTVHVFALPSMAEDSSDVQINIPGTVDTSPKPDKANPSSAPKENRFIVTYQGQQYDITDFLDDHPGGKEVILEYKGKDMTAAFDKQGHSDEAKDMLSTYLLNASGEVKGNQKDKSGDNDAEAPAAFRWLPTADSSPVLVYTVFSLLCASLLVTVANSSAFTQPAFWTKFLTGYPPQETTFGGKFTIRGKDFSVNWVYPWVLIRAERTVIARATAWAGYILHQFLQWFILFKAQNTPVPLKFTKAFNPYAVWMTKVNIAFVLLKMIQSHLFYDGLAVDVPEITALGSVAVMLLIILMLELPRRGLFFGYVKNWKYVHVEMKNVVKRYHGYIISFGIVYDFWYHPCEGTAGHWLGFTYQFLLFIQSSLLFQSTHRNRNWTLWLEVFVWLHGAVTAVVQGGAIWLTFNYGFASVFLITQLWGWPVLVSLKSTRPLLYRIITGLFIAVFIGTVIPAHILEKAPVRFFFIPLGDYVLIFVYYLAFLAFYWIVKKIRGNLDGLNITKDFTWWFINMVIGAAVNTGVLLLYCVILQAPLRAE